MTDHPKRAFLIYLAVLALAGGIVVYIATSRQGPGVSTDAAMMLSTSENVLHGQGLVDYRGLELTQFPPLYSLILSLGSLIFRQDVFVVGWALNILIFSAMIWFSGLYFYRAFTDNRLFAYAASFIVFSSTSLVQISSNISTDPLLLLFVLFFLFLISDYLRSHDDRLLVLTGVLTAVACFERYAALALVITGGLIVAWDSRSNLRRAALRSGIFVAATAIPIFLWGYLHNAPVNGTVFGGRQPSVPLVNFVTGIQKVLYWFIPLRIIDAVGPVLLLGLILLAWLLLLWATRNLSVLKKLAMPDILPSAVFLIVYSAVLVFDISTRELKGINTDRVHMILLPSLLVVGFTLAMPLFAALVRKVGTRPIYGLAILLFVLWTSYPLSKTSEYVRSSLVAGDVSSYNSMNRGNIRSSPLAQYLMGLDLRQSQLYSNGSAKAWFILHVPVAVPPLTSPTERVPYLQAHDAGWPGADAQAYLIWFNNENYTSAMARPQELSAIANLEILYSDGDGTVYKVTAR